MLSISSNPSISSSFSSILKTFTQIFLYCKMIADSLNECNISLSDDVLLVTVHGITAKFELGCLSKDDVTRFIHSVDIKRECTITYNADDGTIVTMQHIPDKQVCSFKKVAKQGNNSFEARIVSTAVRKFLSDLIHEEHALKHLDVVKIDNILHIFMNITSGDKHSVPICIESVKQFIRQSRLVNCSVKSYINNKTTVDLVRYDKNKAYVQETQKYGIITSTSKYELPHDKLLECLCAALGE